MVNRKQAEDHDCAHRQQDLKRPVPQNQQNPNAKQSGGYGQGENIGGDGVVQDGIEEDLKIDQAERGVIRSRG